MTGKQAYNISFKKKGLGQISFDLIKQSNEITYWEIVPISLHTFNRSTIALGQNKLKELTNPSTYIKFDKIFKSI